MCAFYIHRGPPCTIHKGLFLDLAPGNLSGRLRRPYTATPEFTIYGAWSVGGQKVHVSGVVSEWGKTPAPPLLPR
jgi:hypothetical protein